MNNKPLVSRLGSGPVVTPDMVSGYGAIFNAGLLFHQGIYHLFARGVRSGYILGPTGGPRYTNYISDVLVFTSTDGVKYEFDSVLCSAGEYGVGVIEDPRVQLVDSQGTHVIMTYTNLLKSGFHHIGAHEIFFNGRRFVMANEQMRPLGPPNVPNKDAVIFNIDDGRVAMLHRVHPNVQLSVFDSLAALWDASTEYWEVFMANIDEHVVMRPSAGARGIGAGAPPIRVADGLLNFYHETQADGTYTMNLALLDSSTGKVKSRLADPILVPELEWELNGDVNNVIFVQGVHVRNDEVYLVYGAADRCVGAACASLSELCQALA